MSDIEICLTTTRKQGYSGDHKPSLEGKNRHKHNISWRPTGGRGTSVNEASVNFLTALAVLRETDEIPDGLDRLNITTVECQLDDLSRHKTK
jgi:hypothetical protein